MTQENDKGNGERYVLVPQSILKDKKLNCVQKLVYASMFNYEEYWETPESSAENLGLTVRQVMEARRYLENEGYIVCLRNTGRGKVYSVVLHKSGAERYTKAEGSDTEKCNSSSLEKQGTENKVENKEKINTMSKLIEGKSLPAVQTSERKEYGNKDINLLFVKWKEICGFEIKSKVQLNRFACQRLIKSRGLDNIIKALPFVAQSHNDQYAPKIANFMDLEQRWDDMGLWVRKKTATALKQHGTIEI